NSWSGLSTACKPQRNHTQAKLAYASAAAAFEKRKQIRADRLNMRAILARLHADFENFPAALRESARAIEELPGGAGYLLQKAELYSIRMHCEFRLGSPERGFQAAEEAGRILRCIEIPEPHRNQAIAATGVLGGMFWM